MKLTAFSNIEVAEHDDWDVIEIDSVAYTFSNEISFLIDDQHWIDGIKELGAEIPDIKRYSRPWKQLSSETAISIFRDLIRAMRDGAFKNISEESQYVCEIFAQCAEVAKQKGIIIAE